MRAPLILILAEMSKLQPTPEEPMGWSSTDEDHWSTAHEQAVSAIKNYFTRANLIKTTLYGIRHPNASHGWREGYFNLLFHCVVEMNPEAAKMLLENGADPTLANRFGNSAMTLAVKRNYVPMAQLFLDSMADEKEKVAHLNAPIKDSGWTLLHNAANYGHVEMTEWLLENGAHPSVCMENGWSALHAAVNGSKWKIMALLLVAGANPSVIADSHRDLGRKLKPEDCTINHHAITVLRLADQTQGTIVTMAEIEDLWPGIELRSQ